VPRDEHAGRALGELRGPMADETVSWLTRVALGLRRHFLLVLFALFVVERLQRARAVVHRHHGRRRTGAHGHPARDPPPAAARPWYAQRTPGAQAGRQLAVQRASTLNEQRLIDGFMADAHGLIVREVDR